MDLKTTMETYGKRAPYIVKWKVRRKLYIDNVIYSQLPFIMMKSTLHVIADLHFIYKAGVTEEGKLTFVDMKLYCDSGYEMFENDAGEAVHFAQNVYNAEAWKISPHAVITDVMPNSWCRAPGSTQVLVQKMVKNKLIGVA